MNTQLTQRSRRGHEAPIQSSFIPATRYAIPCAAENLSSAMRASRGSSGELKSKSFPSPVGKSVLLKRRIRSVLTCSTSSISTVRDNCTRYQYLAITCQFAPGTDRRLNYQIPTANQENCGQP